MCSKTESSNIDGVIIISETEQSPEFIIQKILGVEDLPTPSHCCNSIKGYEWNLDTKYYSTTITLYSVQERTGFNDDFCDTIQAVIFYFDGKKPSSFENVLNWMPSLKDIPSEVQLLACDSCDDEIYKKRVLNWCIANQYELVEFNSSDETDDDEEDGPFSKSRGFGRIVEALKAHNWPNLIMKEDMKHQNSLAKEEEREIKEKSSSEAASASPKPVSVSSKKMMVDDAELLLEEQWLQKVLEQDDSEGESFEALFSKFASMKEKASGLTGEDRKKYAEKVAIAFWKAVGGEDDEIAGLDDD